MIHLKSITFIINYSYFTQLDCPNKKWRQVLWARFASSEGQREFFGEDGSIAEFENRKWEPKRKRKEIFPGMWSMLDVQDMRLVTELTP